MIMEYGFPKMYKEVNEKRSFLPDFFSELKEHEIQVFLETGYGEKMGYSDEDYLRENEDIIFTTKEKVYSKDVVVVLRAPVEEELKNMKKGAVLISMLHYITRESRNLLMEELDIVPFSMDSMVDDDNRRVVVNNYETSYNGAKIAIEEFEKNIAKETFSRPTDITVVGMGEIGLTVARAFKDLSNERIKKYGDAYPGLKVTMLTRSITNNKETLLEEIKNTDILVDASTRNDTSKFIIGNDLLKTLPNHSVILDITADPYDFDKTPHQVKAIEGIPTGTLDQIVFNPDDKAYLPISNYMNTKEKRIVVSCNAWPGVRPVASKKLYGRQLLPILKVLINKDHTNLKIDSKDYYERILYRSSYKHFKEL